jgi:hypothetical protein
VHGLFPFGRVSGHVRVGSFVVFGCPSRRVFVAAISARYMVSLRLIIPEVSLNMRYRAYLALHIFLGGGLDVQRRALPRLHVSDVLFCLVHLVSCPFLACKYGRWEELPR